VRKKITVLSHVFAPSVGGIQTVSYLLARLLIERGYEVTVVTNTTGIRTERGERFRILRQPSAKALIAVIRDADLILQSNISLRLAWPLWLLYLRKPFILVHHCMISRPNGDLALQDFLKRMLLWRPYCLSVSSYLARTIPTRSKVIRNPYNDAVFRRIPGLSRDGDLLFVGRLVTGKGVDIMLRALPAVLRARPQTTLSIVGSGPHEPELRDFAKRLGVDQSVFFLGTRHGHDLAEVMNRHKILVFPSRSLPPEACPVVPVEAIACGCVPVATSVGGVPESIGRAGVLFEEGNSGQLAELLVRLLSTPELLDSYRAEADEHLRQFQPEAVLDAYEAHFVAAGMTDWSMRRAAA
jgi:glycogen synthase